MSSRRQTNEYCQNQAIHVSSSRNNTGESGAFRLGILGLLLWKQPFITFMLGRQNDSRDSSTEKASMRFPQAKRCLSPQMWLPQSHSPLSIHPLLYLL